MKAAKAEKPPTFNPRERYTPVFLDGEHERKEERGPGRAYVRVLEDVVPGDGVSE